MSRERRRSRRCGWLEACRRPRPQRCPLLPACALLAPTPTRLPPPLLCCRSMLDSGLQEVKTKVTSAACVFTVKGVAVPKAGAFESSPAFDPIGKAVAGLVKKGAGGCGCEGRVEGGPVLPGQLLCCPACRRCRCRAQRSAPPPPFCACRPAGDGLGAGRRHARRRRHHSVPRPPAPGVRPPAVQRRGRPPPRPAASRRQRDHPGLHPHPRARRQAGWPEGCVLAVLACNDLPWLVFSSIWRAHHLCAHWLPAWPAPSAGVCTKVCNRYCKNWWCRAACYLVGWTCKGACAWLGLGPLCHAV